MKSNIRNIGPAIMGPVGTSIAELLECEAGFKCPWCGHVERGRGFEPNHAMLKHLRTLHGDKSPKAKTS